MSELINYYLKGFEQIDVSINYNLSNDNVAVIVEPRNHKYLLGVIKNVMYFLGPKWNLHIFGSHQNQTIIEQFLKAHINSQI